MANSTSCQPTMSANSPQPTGARRPGRGRRRTSRSAACRAAGRATARATESVFTRATFPTSDALGARVAGSTPSRHDRAIRRAYRSGDARRGWGWTDAGDRRDRVRRLGGRPRAGGPRPSGCACWSAPPATGATLPALDAEIGVRRPDTTPPPGARGGGLPLRVHRRRRLPDLGAEPRRRCCAPTSMARSR